jgi:hypothetical protein
MNTSAFLVGTQAIIMPEDIRSAVRHGIHENNVSHGDKEKAIQEFCGRENHAPVSIGYRSNFFTDILFLY